MIRLCRTIRNEHFICRRVYRHVRGLTEIRGVIASGSTPATSDLQKEFAAAVELEELVLTRSGRASSGDPNVVLVIDKDPVLVVGRRPFVTVAGTLPAL